MALIITEEQKMLKDSAAELLKAKAPMWCPKQAEKSK